MRDIPILFKGAMVRAILDGNKTQTRRVLKVDAEDLPYVGSWHERGDGRPFVVFQDAPGDQVLSRLEYLVPYKPGDLMWVREQWSAPHECRGMKPIEMPPGIPIWYWADGNPGHGDWTKPKVSLHIPRWFSRLTLEVTDVRIERLQDLSEDDCMAEGIYGETGIVDTVCHGGPPIEIYGERFYNGRDGEAHDTAYDAFKALWVSINGPESWQSNPWVAAVTFKPHRLNVVNVMESLKNVGQDRVPI